MSGDSKSESGSSGSKSSELHLEQMSYHCPGMHGPGSKQDIRRRTFQDFLGGDDDKKKDKAIRIIIPLCQRRYCWNDHLIKGKDRFRFKMLHRSQLFIVYT